MTVRYFTKRRFQAAHDTEQELKMTDYTKLEGPDLLAECRDDAVKWAASFCQTAKQHGHDIDEGWMIG